MLKITSIHCGYFKLDGGAMFGVVPKRLWEKLNPPDQDNMCTWAMRALLVETEGRKILIDTGLGNKQDEKWRSHFLPHGEESLFGSLQKIGVDRSQITDVLLTHLHFDHCGGALWKNEESGEIECAFPNAQYWSNKKHWDWAMHPNAREKASFLQENFVPLLDMGKMAWIPEKQGFKLAKGISIEFFYGHTEALMAPLIDLGDKQLLYCADALPSQWHVGMPYVMAYDIRPLITIEEKAAMLRRAADEKQWLFLEHDPVTECITVQDDGKGRIVVGEKDINFMIINNL